MQPRAAGEVSRSSIGGTNSIFSISSSFVHPSFSGFAAFRTSRKRTDGRTGMERWGYFLRTLLLLRPAILTTIPPISCPLLLLLSSSWHGFLSSESVLQSFFFLHYFLVCPGVRGDVEGEEEKEPSGKRGVQKGGGK